MSDRQFVIEPLDGQNVNIRSGGQIVGRLTFVGSRVTGQTAGAAASLVTWAGNGQSAVAGATVTPPAVRVLDANGLPVAGSTVTWEGNTISGATQQGLTGTSDSNGVVTLGGWSVGTTAASTYTVFAYSGNLTNSPIRFSITPTAGSAFSIGVSAGDSQSSTPTSLLASRITVLVNDQYGNAVNGVAVDWTSSSADATFGTVAGTTNSSGLVGTTYTTGQSASTESVWAAISSATSARFAVGVVAGSVVAPDILLGDGQTALSGSTLPTNPTVFVGDGFNNPISNVTVDFVIVAGSGNLSRSSAAPSSGGTTDVAWKLGSTAGANRLEVSIRGVSNSTVTFSASGTNPVADTIQIESGNTQTGTVGAALALPLAVATLGSGSSASGQLVTFSATSGSLSTSAIVSSTSGIARTVWTLPTGAGTYTVTASAGTLTGSPLIFSATATAGTATQLILVTQPSSQPDVGVAWPQQPVVASADQYSNLASTNTRVQCVLLSGDGTLASGVSTFATASGATATFSGLSYTYASVNSFQVGFRCNSLSTVTASVQTSLPPFANKLAWTTQPTSATTSGTLGSPAVAVQDALGGTVTTATNAITVSLTASANTEGGTLSGTTTRNAVAGVATFTGLSIDTLGSFTLDATATGLTGATSAAVTISSISASHPNLPSGWTIVDDHDFTSKTEGGWFDAGGTNYNIVTASGASSTTVDSMASLTNRLTEFTGRATYPAGFVGGSGPINTGLSLAASSQSTGLYMHFNFSLSTNFSGHTGSGVNKMWFCLAGTSSSGPIYTSAQGQGSGTLQYQVRLQRVPGGARNLAPNVGTFNITRGQRYDVEHLFILNSCQTDGTARPDGICKVWVNGTLTHNYSNVSYRGNGSTNNEMGPTAKWVLIKWNPTYGGVNGTVPATQYMYMFDTATGWGG